MSNKKIYEKYMKKCLKLAKKGEGYTLSNPMVGAVILDENMNFVSEGYHQKYGEAHAEVNAINSAKKNFKNGTIIVNLEPCSHYGKTPPCADLIINSGIKNVIIGCSDPNPKVAGNGIKKCLEAGLNVIVGILEDDCKKLNEIFFKNQTEKRPFIAIKTATTLDGKIATKNGSSKWITADKSRADVQKLRHKYDAILTSSNTVINDNPSLTCRMKNGKNPIRIILDSNLRTSPNSKVYNNDGTRIILVSTKNDFKNYPKHIEFINTKNKNGHIDLIELTQKLFDIGINSILVEAGGELNGAFLKENLVDKIYHYIAPKLTGDNTAVDFASFQNINDINKSKNFKLTSLKKLGNDLKLEYYPN